MCVIVAKPRGVNPLDSKLVDKIYKTNNDLSGLAILRKYAKKVSVHRGLTDSELKKVNASIKADDLVLYHFRIATSGNVNTINSHPFPLFVPKNLMHVKCRIALAHNGIIKGMGSAKLSDTASLVENIELGKFPDIDSVLTLLSQNTWNKFSTIDAINGILLYGEFKEEDGLYFSNTYWKNTYVYNPNQWNGYNSSTYTYTDKRASDDSQKCDICQLPAKHLTKWYGIFYCDDCLTDCHYNPNSHYRYSE